MHGAITYRAFLVTLPLHSPIPVGQARWTERPVVLLRGEDEHGAVAWGEAAPLDGFGPDTLKDVFDGLSNETETNPPSLACALGTIRSGLAAVRAKKPFGHDLAPVRSSTLRSATLVSSDSDMDGRSEEAPVVKIKVGVSVEEGARRIQSIVGASKETKIRLDGNRFLSESEAHELLRRLGDDLARIEFFEEPFAGCFDADHRSDFPVPLAIDESLNGENWRHADVCILKPSLLGDPAHTVAMAMDMQKEERRVVLSSAFESSVGMTMLAWLAARLGNGHPGFGTYRFLEDDIGGRAPIWDDEEVSLNDVPDIPRVSDHEIERLVRTYDQDRPAGGLTVKEIPVRRPSW